MDNWAYQVYNVYKSVIIRPRFQATVTKEVVSVQGIFEASLFFTVFDQKFQMNVYAYPRGDLHIWLKEYPVDFESKFHYQDIVLRHREHRLRHQALTMMKKLHNKPVYDVMKI